MSFWSEPYIRGFHNKWVNENSWNLSWILSVECITKLYGKPHLYTDDAGKHFLVDQLGLSFESVDLSLNDIRERNPRFFSLGKTYTIGIQREPFIHFDYDFYLLDKIPESLFDSGVLLEKYEYNSYDPKISIRRTTCSPNILEKANGLPSWWNSYKQKNEYNHAKLGIIGGSNFEYFGRLSQSIFDIINANTNDYWNSFSKPNNFPFFPQYTLDEYGVVCVAKEMGITPKYLKGLTEQNFTKYAHVNLEKLISGEIYGRIAARIIKDFPHAIDKAKEFGGVSVSHVPKVSVIIMPNDIGTTYDSLLRVVIPRKVAPDEIFISEYKLSDFDKKLISKIDGVRIVPAGSSYVDSLRQVFKRTSGNLIIVIDGHIKVPKLYIEKCIAANIEYPNSVFCAASIDFSDKKSHICYGGLEDDYGIRPNLHERKSLLINNEKVSSLYGGLYAFPSSILHKVLDIPETIKSFSEVSKYLSGNNFEIRCIKGITVSNNFKASSVFETSKC
jgi:hypothetical protein